jgi:hypothetical protein
MGKRNPKPSSFKASAEQSSRCTLETSLTLSRCDSVQNQNARTSNVSADSCQNQPIEYFKNEEATQILVGQLRELGLRIKVRHQRLTEVRT